MHTSQVRCVLWWEVSVLGQHQGREGVIRQHKTSLTHSSAGWRGGRWAEWHQGCFMLTDSSRRSAALRNERRRGSCRILVNSLWPSPWCQHPLHMLFNWRHRYSFEHQLTDWGFVLLPNKWQFHTFKESLSYMKIFQPRNYICLFMKVRERKEKVKRRDNNLFQ